LRKSVWSKCATNPAHRVDWREPGRHPGSEAKGDDSDANVMAGSWQPLEVTAPTDATDTTRFPRPLVSGESNPTLGGGPVVDEFMIEWHLVPLARALARQCLRFQCPRFQCLRFR